MISITGGIKLLNQRKPCRSESVAPTAWCLLTIRYEYDSVDLGPGRSGSVELVFQVKNFVGIPPGAIGEQA